jgi:predicted nicotinamide N-methyase
MPGNTEGPPEHSSMAPQDLIASSVPPGRRDLPERETFRGYVVREEQWTIAGHTFRLGWPADMDLLLELPATLRRFARDEYMPYWAQPWPVSVLLTEAVLKEEEGRQRPAVEIGCGIGLVSLAAAVRGWTIVASDYDSDALAFTERNAGRNGLHLAGCRYLDYRIPLEAPQFDCVLGSDLLYERSKSAPVARWIASALKPGGFALLGDPNRSAAELFPQHAREAGLALEVRQVETTAPSGLITRGRIWRVTHAASGG